jgi:hypothetical protein
VTWLADLTPNASIGPAWAHAGDVGEIVLDVGWLDESQVTDR